MKIFLKKIVLFAAICLAGALAMFWLPFDRGFAAEFVRGDCYGHAEWIWRRLAVSERQTDVAFVGSSRTLHAVWEKRIEDTLSARYGLDLGIVNLGYCRLGENLPYVFAKDLLRFHRPRLLVVEVREEADRFSHPMFGYLADREDLLWPPVALHPRVFSDCLHAADARLQALRSRFFEIKILKRTPVLPFGYAADSTLADPRKLLKIKEKNAAAPPDTTAAEPPRFPRVWLEKTVELARSRGVEVAFLYLPAYASQRPRPATFNFLKKHGAVWLPPAPALDNPKNWLDDSHTNDGGAGDLAGWLARKIAERSHPTEAPK